MSQVLQGGWRLCATHQLRQGGFRKASTHPTKPEFTHRNVIAAEVENVIAALVSKSFSRAEFLKSLDKFYKAIELAADTIDEFSDKQHFLNTVYERFFQGYSVKVAGTPGIVYMPQPIVDFNWNSICEEQLGRTGTIPFSSVC